MGDGPFKIILQGVETAWNSRVRSEVSRLFQIDDETASNIVSAIPIILLDGVEARTAATVRDRLKPIVEAGCKLVVTDDPSESLPHVDWPELPEVARVPDEPVGRVVTVSGEHPPLVVFHCPGCGSGFQIARASSAPVAVAPRRENGPVAAPPQRESPVAAPQVDKSEKNKALKEPAKPKEPEKKKPEPTSEVGAKLEGDWLDPPTSSTGRDSLSLAPAKVPPAPPRTELQKEPPRAEPGRAEPIRDGGRGGTAPPLPSRLVGSRGTGRLMEDPLLAARGKPEPQPPPPPPAPVAPTKKARADDDELDLTFDDDHADVESDAREPSQLPLIDDEARPPSGVEEEGLQDDEPRAKKDAPLLSTTIASSSGPGTRRRARVDESGLEPIAAENDLFGSKFEEGTPEPVAAARASAPVLEPARAASPPAFAPAGRTNGERKPMGRPRDLNYDEALALLDDDDNGGAAVQGEVPEIKPIDISDTGPIPPFLKGGGAATATALAPPPATARSSLASTASAREDRPPSSAILEPLAPAEADELLGDEENDDLGDLGDDDEPPRAAPPRREPSRGKLPVAREEQGDDMPSSLDLGDDEDEPSRRDSLDDDPRFDAPSPLSADDDDEDEEDRHLESGDDEPQSRSRGKPPSRELEPLDPREALAILGTDDDKKKGGKKPPARNKPGRPPRADASSASKLVPLSASDEDFTFLDDAKRKGKKTDPFARARRGMEGSGDRGGDREGDRETSRGEKVSLDDEESPRPRRAPPRSRDEDDEPGESETMAAPARGAPPPAPKKRTDPFAKAARALAEEDNMSRSGGAGGGRGGREPPREEKPAAKARGAAPKGRVVEGDGDHGLVLSRIASEPLRQKAAELIAEIKGINHDDALKLTDRTIIPVLKGVSRDVAETHLERFKKVKISGRVTTRQKEK